MWVRKKDYEALLQSKNAAQQARDADERDWAYLMNRIEKDHPEIAKYKSNLGRQYNTTTRVWNGYAYYAAIEFWDIEGMRKADKFREDEKNANKFAPKKAKGSK